MAMATGTALALGAGAGLLGAAMQSNAARSAADTQANAANRSADLQWQQYMQGRADMEPWRRYGGGALSQLAYLMGIPGGQGENWYNSNTFNANMGRQQNLAGMGGMVGETLNGVDTSALNGPEGKIGRPSGLGMSTDDFQTGGPNMQGAPGGWGSFGQLARGFGMSDYQADPGYAFRLAEGQKALERSAAARGSALSGGTLKALARYGQDMGSQEYMNAYNRFQTDQGNLYNRLASMAGLGQQTATQQAQLGNQAAMNMGNMWTGGANAQAAGQVGSANAWANALGNGMNSWLMYSMLKK